MRKIKLILLLSIIFLSSGCYNYRELNELSIISAIGIDKTEGGYKMTVQVMNTKKNGQDTNSSGQQPEFVTYTTEGKTIQKMLRNVVLESPRRLYVTHMQLLIIGEDLAKEGIHDILDWFARDPESRKQFYILISKNNQTKEILNTITTLETLNSKKISDNIETDSKFLGISEKTTFEEVLGTYMNDKQEIILPTIEVEGNTEIGEENENIERSSPEAKIKLAPMAVFKEDKMLGYLTKEEALAMNFIKNKIDATIIEYQCENGKYIASEIIESKTKLEPDTSGEKPKLTINIKGKANINEITCDWNLEDDETIKKIEKMLEDEVKTIINDSMTNINQKYNTDIYGFEDLFYKADPKYYKTIKDKWKIGNYNDLDVKIKVNITLPEKGTILKVIKR